MIAKRLRKSRFWLKNTAKNGKKRGCKVKRNGLNRFFNSEDSSLILQKIDFVVFGVGARQKSRKNRQKRQKNRKMGGNLKKRGVFGDCRAESFKN